MDERSASTIQYGHLGRAIYLPGNQVWTFSRALEQSHPILYTGITKTTVVSPFSASQLPSSKYRIPLPLVYPDLAACWPSVGEAAAPTTTEPSDVCDPRVSSLFDIGHAIGRNRAFSSSTAIPIAVVATGECRDSISFRVLEEDPVRLTESDGQSSRRMRLPSVGDTESTEWSSGGAPVRQICYSRAVEGPATWVAARFPSSTVIFQPQYHGDRVPVHFDTDIDLSTPLKLRNSRLESNPLAEISCSQTGGFAHADATFNPWLQKQFGVVDERGNWSIWEAFKRRGRSTDNWTTTCIKSGSLTWPAFGEDCNLDDCPRYDGWATIEWVGSATSFIVSDRRHLVLYQIENDVVWPYSVVLGLNRDSEWILDVKRSRANTSHVFILTTSRILWLDVTPVIQSTDSQKNGSALAPRLSWYHFRDQEDTTLRLNLLLAGEDLYLILYSRLDDCVMAFRCRIRPEGQLDMMHASDPFVLEVPPVSEDSMASDISRPYVRFSTLTFKEVIPSLSRASKKYGDLEQQIIKLFLLDSSLTLRESVYFGCPEKGGVNEDFPGRDALRLKKWNRFVRRTQPLQLTRVVRSMDDFVVDDWDESVLNLAPRLSLSTPATPIIPEWTIGFEPAYAVAAGKLTMTTRDAGRVPRKNFLESIKDLNEKITQKGFSHRHTASTMLEIIGKFLLLDDIDKYAQGLRELEAIFMSQGSGYKDGYRLTTLSRSLCRCSGADLTESMDRVDLVHIYDGLVGDWISCLSDVIPGRTRVMKEKIARRLAVELVLSRVRVTRSLNIRNEGQNLGYSVADDTDTLETAHGKMRAELHVQLPDNQAYPGLSSLAVYSSQDEIPQSVAAMLLHWQPGEDPSSYNWRIAAREQVSESETSQRRSRSRSRSQTGQSRNPGTSSPTLPATLPLFHVTRYWGSQPDGMNMAVNPESSQAAEEDFPMTQVESGIFGGREATRKTLSRTRKRRAAGF